jgi:hypothetical protein
MSWDIEDRLELARRMGYPCGDHAERPERPGAWFSKPVSNPAGMGIGARSNAYAEAAGWQHPLREGDMWMPAFRGLHVSVDFRRHRGGWRQALTVRCDYDTARGRPRRWCIEARTFDVPGPLRDIDAEWLNVEFVGGRVIEAHARRNADFDQAPAGATRAVVVWADQPRPATMAEDFDDADGQLAVPRLGFVYR